MSIEEEQGVVGRTRCSKKSSNINQEGARSNKKSSNVERIEQGASKGTTRRTIMSTKKE
jgi:hypothetical protein